MAAKTAPPSRSRATGTAAPSTRRLDVRGWLGGIRLSGFMIIMFGLVVLATFVLVPTIGTYVDQRQQVDALADAVEVSRDEVAQLEQERQRWSDPAYITSQARERLYYVNPGEVVYLVDNDLAPEDVPVEQRPVSDELSETRRDWMGQFVSSLTEAGLAQPVVAPVTIGVPDEPTPSPSATPSE
ncbi:septum formation initiator family protein [Microbacterium sp. C7(2022)]|uniref:FtsB family cell division protein n=1 Tax=Microbacterium sp. C7(2022) TaxID=2992759 RepID=UPI00237B99D1|nr:septum formation initiator family protein [Microbacterium sp. C7(2022)]MDE0545786.1 septum formation initiator family protein [Microbacterium sp. C7(2022)]